jgi:hypothetical protein
MTPSRKARTRSKPAPCGRRAVAAQGRTGWTRWLSVQNSARDVGRDEVEEFVSTAREDGPDRVQREAFGLFDGDRDDIGGIAVHIGARVSALAGPNDVLVSSTLRDLVIGSGLEFEDRGAHELKGVPGEWRLFAVATT